MRTARALLQTIGLPLLAAIAVAPWGSSLAAEATQAPVITASVAAHRTVMLGDRSVDITVDAADNPLVLMQTGAGDILLELFPREAPQTVASFLDLAIGNKTFKDPQTGSDTQRPFYDGLAFYRVVDGFMIESGSVTDTDGGDPGFRIDDEISAGSLGLDKMPVLDGNGIPNAVLGIRSQRDFQQRVLAPLYKSMGIQTQQQLEARFAEVDQHLRGLTVLQLYELQGFRYHNELQSHGPVRGVIAMANNGPDRNDSRFFITLVDTPWLTGRHTVFGKVRLGMEVVDAIGKQPVDADSHPREPVTLISVRPL